MRPLRAGARSGESAQAIFVELALEDLRRAADLFKAVFEVDAWS